ncbi:MAG: AAA family ATPase [Solirubrobacterales bacterium]
MQGDLNPFIFSRPVPPEDLVDREAEAGQLLQLAEGGHATRLSAPRRYGKTSLIRKVLAEAEDIGMATVEVDFYGVISPDDVAARIERGYGKLRGPLRRMAIAAIRALRPRLSAGGEGARVEISPTTAELADQRLAGLLDLPLLMHERSGQQVLVAFDEFQELLAVKPAVDGLFRSHIQRHGVAASYLFAGSHPGLMNRLFARKERPFFGQARALHLDPLADPDLADYIGERFESAGRDAGEALGPLLDLADGHPQRAMLLAHHLFEAVPRGERASAEHWQQALAAAMAESYDALSATWDALEGSERAVVTALALGLTSLTSKSVLDRYGLSKGGVQHARDRLVHNGELRRVGRLVHLVDPLLGEWVRAQHAPADELP